MATNKGREEIQLDLLGGTPDNEPVLSFSGQYRFLSNFWPAPIAWEGQLYPTLEHAYQSAKTLCPNERLAIAHLATPALAKRAGRTVTLRPDWDSVKIGVMRQLLIAKFSNADLRSQLIATGDRLIVEGNSWGDRFWGQSPVGNGRNELGKLLMERRAALEGAKVGGEGATESLGAGLHRWHE